jgi:hypothetical protein
VPHAARRGAAGCAPAWHRLLRWAAEHADLIGLSGLGRTLDDGHHHEVRWRPEQIDAQVELAGATPVEARH